MNFGDKKLYIGGELRSAFDQGYYDVINPDSETAIARIAWAKKEDTLHTLAAAEEGFTYWSQLSVKERNDWIRKLRDQLLAHEELLRNSIMYEMGKVWEGTQEDFTSITKSLQYYAEEIEKIKDLPIVDQEKTHEHKVVHQPLGVVIAFISYNFPLLNLGFKLGPALAAGCSIIVKPSEYSPLSAYIIGELCHEINFPKGVINIICGDIENVGIPLCESKIPKLVTMIGSTETAKKLIGQSSQTSLKRFSMECGGNAPYIVFDDANVEAAIELGAALKIGNTGQICVAPNRFYIHETVKDRFIAGLLQKFKQTKLGFGRENQPDMGPLANKASVHRIQNIVDDAIKQGGKLLCGGEPVNQMGYYYPPTIIYFENQEAEILQQEIFGPVAFIVSFKNQKRVLKLANSTNVGLASYVFSGNEEVLSYFAEHLEFGEVQLNGVKYDIYLPHGGIKDSGVGVDCSPRALDDYLIKKRVTTLLSVG